MLRICPRLSSVAALLSQLSTTMNNPAKQNPVRARATTHAIGSIRSRCRSGAVEAIAPRATKARMWPTLWISLPQRSDPITTPTPETCADSANLSWREALDPAANAQQRGLQCVAHLHESETQEECKQSRIVARCVVCIGDCL